VRGLFLAHADETRVQRDRLTERLKELGGSVSALKAAAAGMFSIAPRTAQLAHAPEERTAQNLMAAYTVEAAECAMYEALIVCSRAAGDHKTTELASAIQREAHQTAEKFWGCLPSRSLIAYNMLTITEIDPSVETKVGESSWSSSS
jgi:ferritin-like metal-binding protein YciE